MPAERAYVPNVPATLMTAEELLAANVTDKRTELVRGVLVVREPAGGRHGRGVMKLAIRLAVHAGGEGAGHRRASQTGFAVGRGAGAWRTPGLAVVRVA